MSVGQSTELVRAAGGPAPAGRSRPAGTGRDRGIDGLRAYAIGGVVLGHWLVTALVLTPDGVLTSASPLTAMTGLAPATWLLQTLGLFFFVSGYAAARSRSSRAARDSGTPDWLRRRLGRLARPVATFLGVWAVVLVGAALAGVPGATLRTLGTLAISPLWFLLPLVALNALTGPLLRALDRYGPLPLAGAAVLLVALSDLAGAGLDTAVRRPVAVLAAWLVPYLLGLATATGRFGRRRRHGWLLLAGGGGALAALVLLAGYPASAVGVPGAGRSNLDPPSVFAVALALAQVGAALLVRPALARWLTNRPGWWRPVHRLNAAALPVYLCHQSVLIGLTVLAAGGAWLAGTGPLPGLHTAPSGPGWIVARLAWLPLLGLGLAPLLSARRQGR